MSILSRLFSKSAQSPTSTMEVPAAWLLSAFGIDNSGKILTVSPENAVRISTYYACMRVIAEDIAALPIRVLDDRDTGKTNIKLHPVYRLLEREPNKWQTPIDFRQNLIAWACTLGNAYAEIRYDSTGKPVSLTPIHPALVKPEIDDEGNLAYMVQGRAILADEMLHIKGIGDGITGHCLAHLMAKTLGLAQALENNSNSLFANGCQMSGILRIPPGLSDVARAKLKKQFQEKHTGTENAGSIALLETTFDFTKLAFDPESTETIKHREHQILEICKWFRVPPHKIGYLTGLNYNLIEQLNIDYANSTLLPWAKRLEQECERKLMTESEREYLSVQLDFRGVMRTTHAQRAAYYNTMRNIGALNANEIRALEDFPRRTDEFGDEYFQPLNMTPEATPPDEEQISE